MQRKLRPVLMWVKEVKMTTRSLCKITSPEEKKPPSWVVPLKGSKEASSLYHRISALGSNSAGVIPTLDQWVNVERQTLCTYDITCFINQLRKHNQFDHALQLLAWLEKKGILLPHSHHAKKIDLLCRSKGIMSAEKYFMLLPDPAKNKNSYTALLNCYCREKISDKAIKLVKKMREMNFDRTTFVYTSLMTLYMNLGEPEKVIFLAKEMKEREILPDNFSYSFLLRSYASLKDARGVERVLEEMNAGGTIEPHWSVYSNLASTYIASGLYEKAELALKEIEKRNESKDQLAYHYLLSMYASIGRASEVSHVWQTLKSAFPRTTNLSYLIMLQTLVRLNDLDGLRRCFKEWESNCLTYDIRLVNVVILGYLKQEMIEEAKLLLEGAINRGLKPNSATFILFVDFYMENRCVDLALTFLKKAITDTEKHDWELYQKRAHLLMQQFENEIDVDSTKELQKILEQAKTARLLKLLRNAL